MQKPNQYNVYKGTGGKFGGIQFSLLPAHYVCKACKMKVFAEKPIQECQCKDTVLASTEGCVFIQATSAKGPNVYDWDNKVIFALSLTDIGKLLKAMRSNSDVSLYHDPNQQSDKQGQIKKILAYNVQDPAKGGIFNLSEQGSATPKKHTIPMTPDEVIVLGTLLQAAIPRILGWQ